MENAGDLSHVAFAHRDASVSWDETVDGPVLTPVESLWGVETRAQRPSGRRNVGQIGFPNVYHTRGVPDDVAVPYREFIGWVQDYLSVYGIESSLIRDDTGKKANLHATIGDAGGSGYMLSGHTDVVPVDESDDVDQRLGKYPYLGPAMQAVGRTPEADRTLRNLHLFNISGVPSVGLISSGINGLS